MTCYHDLTFQPDMLTAKREDGTTVRLSRQEHALLLRFVRHPHTLITRAELLEALGSKKDNLSERNIDYLVNRLRKRLGDTARDSRFIATRYGDGYIWVADPVKSEPISAFLLIGPVYGSSGDLDIVGDFLNRLATNISTETGGQQIIMQSPDWKPDPHGRDALDYTLDVSTHIEDGTVHLAMVLREGRSRRIVESFRRKWLQESGFDRIDELSHEISCALWYHALLIDLGAEAAVMWLDDKSRWRDSVAYLHLKRENEPARADTSVMLALNAYMKLIRSIHAPLGDDAWEVLETEIENLALKALPDAHKHSHLLLSIAKLLRFIDRGYLELAGRLTNEAFQDSTSFAEVFAMIGQIEASGGEVDDAVRLYDKAISMIEPNSKFHIHLLILKIFALMAGNNRADAYNSVVDLHNVTPVNKVTFGLLFVPPKAGQLCSDAERMFAAMTHEDGRHLTRYMFKAWARQFQRHEHQRNIMSGFVHHIQRHHGSDYIAPEISKRFPELIISKPNRTTNQDLGELNSLVYRSGARTLR